MKTDVTFSLFLKLHSSDYRLTFWLSNTIVLRTIISRNSKDLVVSSNHGGFDRRRKSETNGNGKIASSSQRWKGGKNESTKALGYESFGNWDDPHVFISALEEVEAWIFSRIVESIWWQVMPYSYLGPARRRHILAIV